MLRTSSCVFRSCLPFPVLAYGVWLPLRTRAFPFFSSSSSVFFYARANIIMCLSFSSRVLRYKNLLCKTSVIQRITKKFQGIRIICLVKVCLLALKGLLLHPQSREMRHFRQCYWLGETNVGDFLDSDLHLVSYLSGAKGARTDKTSGGWMVRLLWKFRKKTFSKKLSKTFGGYDKISYLCIRFRKRWQTRIRVLWKI